MEKDWKNYLGLYLRIFHTVSLYPAFLLVWVLCNLAMTTFRTEESYIFWISAIFTYFVFFSVARVFFESDIAGCRALAEGGTEGFWRRALAVLRSRGFLIHLCVLLFWVLILPFEAGQYPLAVLLAVGGFTRAQIKLLVLAICLPLYVLLLLLAKLSAWQNFLDSKRVHIGAERGAPDMMGDVMARGMILAHGMGESSNTPVNEPTGTIDAAGRRWLRRESFSPSLFLRYLGLLVIYTFGGFGLFLFAPVLYSIRNALLSIGAVRWWLPFLLIAATVGGFWVFFLIRACVIRRRFFKKLKRLCREYGFRVECVKRPYASIFRYRDGINLRIQANKKTYDCKLFSALRRHHEMFFDEKGCCRIRHTLRFRRVEFLSYTTQYEFSFESEHTKLCIVAPVPKVLYAGNEHFHRPIDTGMKVGEYRIFSTTGLLNALRRDCIEKN